MNNIDPSRIRWIKNVKRDGGQSWAYFEDYRETNQKFPLHWPQSKRGNAKHPNKGDIILIFQNYKKEGARLTHLVEVVDDDSFIDPNNQGKYETARNVRLIYRSKRIINGQGFKYIFRAVSYGTAHSIHLLDSSQKIEDIQKAIYDLFKKDWKSSFFVEKRNGESYMNIPPNKLFNENQTVKLESKIITLIGENGCGKSAILESIFKSAIYAENFNFVCFSSGQNERFTKLFYELKPIIQESILKEENSIDGNDEYESPLKVFYFDKTWIRLIIALATSYFPNGKVRCFLSSNGYCRTNGDIDVTTKFEFKFNIARELIRKIQSEEEKEEDSGFYSQFLHSRYYDTIDKILNKYYLNIPLENLSGNNNQLSIDVKDLSFIFGDKFELPINLFRIDQEKASGVFLLESARLLFDGLELNELSDGEYQLLAIYALLDLFDSQNTFFLFDEIDSHLHYRNIDILWNILKNQIESTVITTTHNADSFIQNNNLNSIKLVIKGQLSDEYSLNSTIERIKELTSSKEYEFKIASTASNIVPIDNINDWRAFKTLASIKCANYDENIFSKIKVLNVSAGSDDAINQIFGDSKIKWVENFMSINKKNELLKTKSIFMLCDRDENNIKFCDDGVRVTGKNKQVQFGNGRTAYLLSWKRRQIENYYMSYTLANRYNILDQLNKTVLESDHLKEGDSMDVKSVRNAEVKDIFKVLYSNATGLDYKLRDEILHSIPASEISEDIENMYNFIVSKIN